MQKSYTKIASNSDAKKWQKVTKSYHVKFTKIILKQSRFAKEKKKYSPGWVGVKGVLRIAYINQKLFIVKEIQERWISLS